MVDVRVPFADLLFHAPPDYAQNYAFSWPTLVNKNWLTAVGSDKTENDSQFKQHGAQVGPNSTNASDKFLLSKTAEVPSSARNFAYGAPRGDNLKLFEQSTAYIGDRPSTYPFGLLFPFLRPRINILEIKCLRLQCRVFGLRKFVHMNLEGDDTRVSARVCESVWVQSKLQCT